MKTSLVTVIVPVFNKDKYITRCLQSIQNQSYTNLEILVIDDGSTDKSVEKIMSISEKDERFRVFVQENLGVSSARNRGLQESKGEYVIFVDADDSVDESFIFQLLNAKRADLVVSTYVTQKMGKRTINDFTESFVSGMSQRDDVIFSQEYFAFLSVPWAKLFNNKLIQTHDICFAETDYGEDTLFVLDYLKIARSLNFIRTNSYINNIVEGTISRSVVENIWDKLDNILTVAIEMAPNNNGVRAFMFIRNSKLALNNYTFDYQEFKKMFYIISDRARGFHEEAQQSLGRNDRILLGLIEGRKLITTFLIFRARQTIGSWRR
ncbi:glycosyltransferase family 2 protein [Lacticaseibacillus pantheris]|uniref:glycosyltransferase family 2 protein n=1 Tax=Lacticaseibacillus pantheris TaxID=171523 RepID=UPI000704C47E|nr:glycosyltransferase family A protein [Lacticaseibacillus pantheris]